MVIFCKQLVFSCGNSQGIRLAQWNKCYYGVDVGTTETTDVSCLRSNNLKWSLEYDDASEATVVFAALSVILDAEQDDWPQDYAKWYQISWEFGRCHQRMGSVAVGFGRSWRRHCVVLLLLRSYIWNGMLTMRMAGDVQRLNRLITDQ